MADNVPITAGTGTNVASASFTFSGDTVQAQMVGLFGLSGSEGSWTAGVIGGDATNGIDVDVTRMPSALTYAAHDAAVTGNPAITGGYASAAAPTDVSADGDAVRAWYLRSGAQAIQPTYAGVLATTGNGASGTGVQRVTLANDSTGVIATVSTVTNVATIGTSITPGTSAAHLGKAEDAAHASGDTGVMALAVRSDTAAAKATTDGDYIPLIVDSSGRLWVNMGAGTANLSAAATGGYTPGRIVAAASTNTGFIKASAGTLGWLMAINLTSTPKFLKLYNKTSAPTLASDTPVLTIPIPGNSTSGAGFVSCIPAQGLNFSTGIAYAITGAIGDTDTTALSANDVVVSYAYA